MSLKRIMTHLNTPGRVVNKYFPPSSMHAIEEAIKNSEAKHTGEIRFAVESSLSMSELLGNKSARDKAIEVFSNLHIWDTEANNGVLIYLLLADRDVEIVADRGINAIVGNEGWETICKGMEKLFRDGKFEDGVLHGINEINAILTKNYPATEGKENPNELPNKPVVIK